jgi:hypothetical protein
VVWCGGTLEGAERRVKKEEENNTKSTSKVPQKIYI